VKLIVLSLCIFTIPSASYSKEVTNVDSLLNKAKEVFSKNKPLAFDLETRALKISLDNSYKLGLTKSNYYLGYYFVNVEGKIDYGKAVVHYLEAIRYGKMDIKNEETSKWLKLAYLNIGALFREYQAYDLATDYYMEGISISNSDSVLIRKFLHNLQNAQEDAGQFDQALTSTLQLLDISLKNSKEYFRSLNNFGLMAAKKGDLDLALLKFREMKEEAKMTHNYHYYVLGLHNIGWTFSLANQFEESRRFLETAIKEGVIHQSEIATYRSHKLLGKLLYENGLYSESLEYSLKTEQMIPRLSNEPRSFEVYHTISEIHKALDDPIASTKYALLYTKAQNEYLNEVEKIKSASQQYNMQLIVANYYQELEAQQKALKTKNIMGSIIVGLGTMLLMFVGYHFAYRYKLKRILSKEIERLKWID